MKELLEDNWHDIVCKAMRGQKLEISLLVERSQVAESMICSLIEEAILDEQTLVAVAPFLNLSPEDLLIIAREPHVNRIPELPENFKCLTTSHHGMEVHSYLLWSNENKKAIAFDTGGNLAPLLKQLNNHQLELSAIFLTHSHSDHVGQLQKLIEHTGAPAWIDKHDSITLAQSLPPLHRYQLDSIINVESRSTPGHSPGGTSYIIHGLSPMIAIVGDALFARSVGGIPSVFYHQGLKAIREKILSLPENTIIAPGHGPLTTVEDEKANNPFFKK